MRPLPLRPSRRTVLQAGAGLVVAGGASTVGYRLFGDRFEGIANTELPAPELLRSSEGLLDVELSARMGTHRIAGRQAETLGYNGGVPGPTLQLRPGDRLRIALTNELDEPTNLHVHGLHVSPSGPGDDVFASLAPGERRQYEYQLGDDHPVGTGWYHPHRHGLVAGQVSGGLFGAITVIPAGEENQVPPEVRERVLIVHDMALRADGSLEPPSDMAVMMGRMGDLVLINGALRPEISGAPGGRERWSVLNASSSRYLTLDLPSEIAQVSGRDMTRSTPSGASDSVELAPGNRIHLDVVLPEKEVPIEASLRTGDTGTAMMDAPERVSLGTLRPRGRTSSAAPPPILVSGPIDLRSRPIAGRRAIVFGPAPGSMMAAHRRQTRFDGRVFDPNRIDQQIEAGSVEEWTLRNETPMDHPFHLHVWPMQVMEVAGVRVDEPLWLDVVDVPRGRDVVVRVAFEDYTGRTVYHCHILDHEDKGMMGTVEVAAT